MNVPSPETGSTTEASGSVTTILWMLLVAVAFLMVINRLVTQSFFFDGNIYASIARNMAEGIGSAWSPHFSKTLFPVFAEHPPLMMWLEALGFLIFGDTIVVEKVFSLFTFLAAGLLLFRIWISLHEGDVEMQSAVPIALLMTLIAGRLSWAFGNGMLENMLMVFTSAAVLFVITAYDQSQRKSALKRTGLIVCAGMAVGLALLTKGPVGLFPLAAPGLYWLLFRRPSFWVAVLDSLILLTVILLFCLALWSFEASREATQRYLEAQLLPSLAGERGQGSGGWAALRTLLRVNAYPLLITACLFAAAYRWGALHADSPLRLIRYRRAAYLFVLGCSASLPLLVSPRVSSFYFNPSIAYFAAGLSTCCAPILFEWLGKIGARARAGLHAAAICLLVISLITVGWNFGRPGRDEQTIQNATKIAAAMCREGASCGDTVLACGSVSEDWALHAYMQRYYKMSIERASTTAASYMVADDSCQSDPRYKDTGLSIVPYRLLQLRD